MEMESQLNQMYSHLKKKRYKLRKLKIDYFGIIYKGVLEHKTIRQIHQELYDRTINSKVQSRNLLVMMYKLSRKAKKLDKGVGNYYGMVKLTPTGLETANNYNIQGGGLTTLALGMLDLFSNEGANKLINLELMKEQDNKKVEVFNDYIQEKRDNNIYFYIASRHSDCAKDHLPYQGKLYYDDKFKDDDKHIISDFIKKNKLLSIQEVTSKPIWFITRPYCRHFFRAVRTTRAINGTYAIPTRKKGSYDLQTKKGANLEYYKDRLAYLEKLNSIHSTRKLQDMILKTKMLIAKWQKSL